MQFTTVISALAMALFVSAAPAEVEARNSGDSAICTQTGKQYCCNGLLNCVVQVAQATCSNKVYCCKTDNGSKIGSTISIVALNCVNIL